MISKILKAAASLVLVGVTALSLVACGSSTSSASPSSSTAAPASASAAAPASASAAAPAASTGNYASTITVVWYPNESAKDFDSARQHIEDLIAQATGKKVIDKVTTDYNIAIQAIASGSAQISFMGALGFIQAQQQSKDILPLVVNSGASGTLDDAVYYSRICVLKGQEQNYMANGQYALDNIQGKSISFVSTSSTSGFLIPTTAILNHFIKTDKWKALTQDDMTQGGTGKFFSAVLFGTSHQGSAVNLLSSKSDLAAFDDTDLAPYVKVVSGDIKTPGSVFEVQAGASAPFDTLVGKQFVIIQAAAVQNGPFVYNSKTLNPSDVKAIQTLFTSAAVTNDQQVFVPSGATFKGFLKHTKNDQFMVVDNSWYDPIRKLLQ